MPMSAIASELSVDKRFQETFFLVEASSFEKHYLWKEWNEQVKWEGESSGYLIQVGELGGRPVTISISWVRIDGRLVGFWNSPSQVSDYKMVTAWLGENCVTPNWDRGTRNANCDATNFHLCLNAIRDANKA